MVQFIGSSYPIQQVGNAAPTYGVGGVFDALAKPFLDSGTTQVKQSVFDKNNAETQKMIDARARIAAATAGVGDLSAPNFNALRAGVIAGDVDPKAYANLLLMYHANNDGAAATATQNAQVGAGQSYGNTAASDNARNATQRYGTDAAERTKMAIAANTPQTVLVPNEDDPNAPPVPTIVRQADSYGKPASVGLTEQQGAAAAKLAPRILAGDENVPEAALKMVGAQPTKENVYNWVQQNPDGTVARGRTLDGGTTDATSGKPLKEIAPNAQLVGPSNAGGAGSMLPPGGLDQSQKNKLIPQRDALRQVVGLSQTLRGMAEKSPELVGPTGNVIRGTQDVVDLGNSISQTFGDPKQFQDAYAKAVQDMQARGVKVPVIMTNDPRASAMVKLNTILTYQAASALAGQQGRSMSDQDFDAAQKMVGTPDSWMHGPTNYINGLKTIEDYASGQMGAIDKQLQAGNIAPPGVTPPASAPAAAPGNVVKWGRDAQGNPVRVQ